MKRPRLARVARIGPWVAVGALLAACNALTGLSDDYHLAPDSGGTTPDTGTPDTSTPDTSTPDTSTPDVNIPDVATICDGGVDAAGLEVCEDFESEDAGADYYKADAAGFIDASMTTVLDAGYGQTRGLVVDVLRANGGTSHVWAAYTLQAEKPPNQYSHYDVSFRVKVLSNNLQYVTLGLLTFIADIPGNGDLGAALYPNIIKRNNDASGNGVATKGDWHLVRITFDRLEAGPNYRRALYLDDMTKPLWFDDAYVVPSSLASEVRIGVFYTGPQPGSVSVAFDQLVVHRNLP